MTKDEAGSGHVRSVGGSPAGHVTVADTSQSTLDVRDPDVGGRKQPRDPDEQDEDASSLRGERLGQ